MHWQLDMIFREDESTLRINHTPENMSLLRKAALNVMKNETVSEKTNKCYKKMSLKSKRYAASLDNRFLEALLFG